MDKEMEKDVGVLSGLFSYIITDLKGSTPIWEDFVMKTGKLHSQLKVTMSCLATFVEAMQRIADMATSAQGATRDVGKALTRLCLRHRAFESRLKALIDALQDALIIPMTDKIEDWKRVTTQIDRTHSKEFKRARSELKKKNTDTLRLRKKVKRASSGVGAATGVAGLGGAELAQKCLSHALQGMQEDYVLLEENQRQAVRRALIEQRRRYCAFVHCIKPVMDEEVHLLEEVSHLEEVVDSLCKLTTSPERLPTASEQVIEDAKMGYTLMSESIYGYHGAQSPPSSPGSSLGSRKSSMCSISSESNSADVIYGNTHRGRSLSQPPPLQVSRLCSVSSQDSGFNSTHGGNGLRRVAQQGGGHRALEGLFQRQTGSDENTPTGTTSFMPAASTGLSNTTTSTTTSTSNSSHNPIYDMRSPLQPQQQHSPSAEQADPRGQAPPSLPRRNNSLPSNSLFESSSSREQHRDAGEGGGHAGDCVDHGTTSSTSYAGRSPDRHVCHSEPQSPQLTHRGGAAAAALSITTGGQLHAASDTTNHTINASSLFLSRTPSQHMSMSTLPVRGRDRSRKVPPAPPIRRTPPTSTLNVALQLRQLEEQGKTLDHSPSSASRTAFSCTDSAEGKGEGAKSPELPLPSPPAELLSPTEENSIYGRMIKSCHATLERPHVRNHQTSGAPASVGGPRSTGLHHHQQPQQPQHHHHHHHHHHQPHQQQQQHNHHQLQGGEQGSPYHEEHNAYLGGICSQITEKFGTENSSSSGSGSSSSASNTNSYFNISNNTSHNINNSNNHSSSNNSSSNNHSNSNHNIYATFGKGKKNSYRRTESQDSDEQTKSEASESITKEAKESSSASNRQTEVAGDKSSAGQRNSKMYKCASSDDILAGRSGSWAPTPGVPHEENLYEPINKELNESIYSGSSSFGVSIAISTNDIYGSTSHQLAASANGASGGGSSASRTGVAPPAPPERRTPQRRAQSYSNDLYGTIEDEVAHSSRSKVQQVKETFEHLRQASSGEPLYGRVSQSQSTSSRCSSPSGRQASSPFPSNKLSMYQGPPGSESSQAPPVSVHNSSTNTAPSSQQQHTTTVTTTSGILAQHHHSQFSIYATKNEVLTPGVPVSIPKVPTDLSKKRFMQQLNEKLAQGSSQGQSGQQQASFPQATSIYGTIRSCNTATINKGRRCSSESRGQNGQQQQQQQLQQQQQQQHQQPQQQQQQQSQSLQAAQQQRPYGCYTGGSGGNVAGSDSEISPASHRVQEWLSGRPPVKDIGECKRSVLDQIRRGGKNTSGGPPRL